MLRISYFTVIFAAILTLLCGCGSNDHFVVEGEFEGEAPQSVRALYFANGALRNAPVSVREGKFKVEGRSEQPVIIDIYLPDRTRIATVVAHNGETVKLKLNSAKPFDFSAEGDDTAEKLSEWVAANATTLSGGNRLAVNKLIERYIESHKAELLSTVLLMSYYDSSVDPLKAAELFDIIDAEARPLYMVEGFSEMLGRMKSGANSVITEPISYYVARDSSNVFKPADHPYTLIALTSSMLGRDSIVGELKQLSTLDRLKLVELSVDNDSMAWRRSIIPDSAAWTQGWLPGGAMRAGVEQLSVPRLPYFVVVDSTGHQLLRTPSVTLLSDSIPQLLP